MKNRNKRRGLKYTILRAIKLFFILSFIGCMGAIVAVAASIGPTIYEWYLESRRIADASSIDDFRSEETSYVYDDSGSVLLKLRDNKDVQYVEYKDLPKGVVDAFVSIEDRRFYQHSGVDWASTLKAAFLLVVNHGEVQRGGSTITQQLARNIYLSFTVSYERKMREIFLALELEKRYSKDQILEFYVNNVTFGNGYYGIGAAADGYFDKSVDELSLGEMAFLCSVPNNPTYYNPRKNYDNVLRRQRVILEEMFKQGKITSKECIESIQSPIVLVEKRYEVSDYAASYALHCAVEEIMRIHKFNFVTDFATKESFAHYQDLYSEAYEAALHELKTGGYRIHTSLNSEAQETLQYAIDKNLSDFTERCGGGTFTIQGAATVVDNKTGQVIASVGGRSDDSVGTLGLNRAFQSYKQPGSTIKPLIVYTPALERGYSADSIVSDRFSEEGPSNSNGRYSGDITLRQAVEQSKNTVAWSIFEQLTPQIGLQYLRNMQFDRIVCDDFVPAASLGGLTYGVTTEEMAGAYSALANSGIWSSTTCITSILDKNGVEVYGGMASYRVYSTVAANYMTDILLGVSKRGTAAGLRLENGSEFACKTGTTNNNTVGWFCGYTDPYTVAVYVGADSGSDKVEGLSGSTYPASIWVDVQNSLLGDEVSPSLLSDAELEQIERAYGKTEPQSQPAPAQMPQSELETQSDQQPDTQSESQPEPQPELQQDEW